MTVSSTVYRGIDLVAVERLVSGELPRPVIPDHQLPAVGMLLTGRGLSVEVIGERLGVPARTVSRWRSGAGGGL